jgi:hypothetical protein
VRQNAVAVNVTFNTVLWVVCIAAVVIGAVALFSTSKTWQDFGKDRLMLDSDIRGGPAGHVRSAGAEPPGVREEEIRQMLEARNARRVRRGEQPLDVEEELGRLTRPRIDPALRGEIRDLVVARNYRRARAGKPALDIEAEVERQIAELGDL